jgi:nucleoside-diphosphate-sugar epimerase
MILVTGSAGLVGRGLCARLAELGLPVRPFDIKRAAGEDVREAGPVAAAVRGATGILHLAAVSRVIDGERDPENCRRTNLGGLKTVLDAALGAQHRPWFVFVSSREVYGDAAAVPTGEDSPYSALNVYARTKVEGELMVTDARAAGLLANTCRLSTVYGSLDDHADRVLPAFCRAAATGGQIAVQGTDVVLDPTHVHDVVRGIVLLVEQTADRQVLPPIHFVSGRGLSIMELARLAVGAGNPATRISIQAPRSYDVKRFVGDPTRAKALLGWRSEISVESGVEAFVSDFRRAEMSRSDAGRSEARPVAVSL